MPRLLAFALISLLASQAVAADYTDPVTGMEFVRVKGGTFIMGDIYGTDPFARPSHQVTVRPLLIGKYEVTFAQFDRFCAETGHPKPDDNGWGRGQRPVVNVSRQEAIVFAEWLGRKIGKTVRLPSEAEWEYAARGGKSTPYWWGNQLGAGNANCRKCGSEWDDRMTAPVGSFSANPYGLHDTHGNVYEWVLDSWHKSYEGAPRNGTAWVDAGATEFVSRGGSFAEVNSSMPVFARNWSGPEAHRDIGFRLVIEEK